MTAPQWKHVLLAVAGLRTEFQLRSYIVKTMMRPVNPDLSSDNGQLNGMRKYLEPDEEFGMWGWRILTRLHDVVNFAREELGLPSVPFDWISWKALPKLRGASLERFNTIDVLPVENPDAFALLDRSDTIDVIVGLKPRADFKPPSSGRHGHAPPSSAQYKPASSGSGKASSKGTSKVSSPRRRATPRSPSSPSSHASGSRAGGRASRSVPAPPEILILEDEILILEDPTPAAAAAAGVVLDDLHAQIAGGGTEDLGEEAAAAKMDASIDAERQARIARNREAAAALEARAKADAAESSRLRRLLLEQDALLAEEPLAASRLSSDIQALEKRLQLLEIVAHRQAASIDNLAADNLRMLGLVAESPTIRLTVRNEPPDSQPTVPAASSATAASAVMAGTSALGVSALQSAAPPTEVRAAGSVTARAVGSVTPRRTACGHSKSPRGRALPLPLLGASSAGSECSAVATAIPLRPSGVQAH